MGAVSNNPCFVLKVHFIYVCIPKNVVAVSQKSQYAIFWMLLDRVDMNAAAVRRELETVAGNRKIFWMKSSKMAGIETFKKC